MLLWRDKPQTILALNETERKSKSPVGIHVCLSVHLSHKCPIQYVSVPHHVIFCFSSQFSCLVAVPSPSGPAAGTPPQDGLVPWAPGDGGPEPGLSRLPTPRHRSGPVLTLRLFVTENYEQKRIGPCVVTAGHRVYVEVCVSVNTKLLKVKASDYYYYYYQNILKS